MAIQNEDFDSESQFRIMIMTYWDMDCAGAMPHALQNLREFWLSTAPKDMDTYLRARGFNSIADRCLAAATRYVTLDPPQLMATLDAVAM